MAEAFSIGGVAVPPGQRRTVDLPFTDLSTHTPMTMPVQVVHGRRPGPRLFVSAAIHGDEINGVEIIRRLLKLGALRRIRGTLVAVPVVNVFGFVSLSRYLPDRRDLNRSFPGSARGSLAGRLAALFVGEIVARCSHGIDLHTGAIHRDNYPQIRANLDDAETERMALAFGVPVVINSGFREGSLREAAAQRGVPVIVYEASEALRFDEFAVRAGVRGVVGVMRMLGMVPERQRRRREVAPMLVRSSTWVRAPQSGVLRRSVALGRLVAKDERLGAPSPTRSAKTRSRFSPPPRASSSAAPTCRWSTRATRCFTSAASRAPRSRQRRSTPSSTTRSTKRSSPRPSTTSRRSCDQSAIRSRRKGTSAGAGSSSSRA